MYKSNNMFSFYVQFFSFETSTKAVKIEHNTRKITGVGNFEFNTATKLNNEDTKERI